MTCIEVAERAFLLIVIKKDCGQVLQVFAPGIEPAIEPGKKRWQFFASLHLRVKQAPECGHYERSGQTVAACVGYYALNGVVANAKIIEVISPNEG